MVREMNHIGLKVCDVDKAIKFYSEILGGIVIRNSGSLDGKSRFVYIQLGGSVLELITAHDPALEGYAHIAFLTDAAGLDAAYEKLAAEGYEFTVLPKVAGSGDGRLAFFKDDSGVIYELIQREEDIRKPTFATELVTDYLYTTVRINKEWVEKTDAFYTNELSFARKEEGLYGFGYDHLRVVPTDGEGVIESITFKVPDLEKTCKALADAGFKVEGSVAYGAGGEKVCLVV